MTLVQETAEAEIQFVLPPVMSTNPRYKINPEQIPVTDLEVKIRKELKPTAGVTNDPKPVCAEPEPRYPLTLSFSPAVLHFEINKEDVTKSLRVWNSCHRPLYIQLCGLYNDTARLGASWSCYPRTRFYLPPGFKAEMHLRATPRATSPVPYAYSGLQVAAAHMRDHVTAHFMVPVCVKFLNCVLPAVSEEV